MAISFANSSHNHDMYSYTHKMYIWIECLAQTELHVVSECQLPVSRDLGQLYTVFGRGNFSTSHQDYLGYTTIYRTYKRHELRLYLLSKFI